MKFTECDTDDLRRNRHRVFSCTGDLRPVRLDGSRRKAAFGRAALCLGSCSSPTCRPDDRGTALFIEAQKPRRFPTDSDSSASAQAAHWPPRHAPSHRGPRPVQRSRPSSSRRDAHERSPRRPGPRAISDNFAPGLRRAIRSKPSRGSSARAGRPFPHGAACADIQRVPAAIDEIDVGVSALEDREALRWVLPLKAWPLASPETSGLGFHNPAADPPAVALADEGLAQQPTRQGGSPGRQLRPRQRTNCDADVGLAWWP